MADDSKPHEDDLRHDDHEYDVAIEPSSAKAWLNLLQESEDAFEPWNNHCDNLDKLYANLEQLSSSLANGRIKDKQFAMFWANCEVLKPSIYAKPPIPVVVPKFKDRRPVYQAASELMERCTTVAFDLAHINDLMLLVRDDVSMIGRGVAWCRYESGDEGEYDSEKVCIDFKDRHDFLHSVSRNWREVQWVAAASYLTRPQARERFHKHSGDAYQQAEYKVDKDAKNVGGADNRERAKFWEIWHKGSKRVVWVAEGVEDILDEDEPHLKLRDFYPCPKPAYGTVQRGSLVPVPDAMQYRDQLEEVNLLTAKIHALSESLQMKGFYPAGGAEMADAIQTAVRMNTPGISLVPIANWSAFGAGGDPIIWLEIEKIAATILSLVQLRKQVIEDIYQITGMSDIMRGATDANETLGAQQLKVQSGSVRIRDKQGELVRLARDLAEITCEIMCEKFDDTTLILMSQTQLPTNDMQEEKAEKIIAEVQALRKTVQQMQAMGPPQQGQQPGMMGHNGGPPMDPSAQAQQQLQQLEQQAQVKLQKMNTEPTVDQVLRFLRNEKARAFMIDIETDSTIQIDEMGEKQRITEFVGMLGGLLPQLAQMITMEPSTAPFCGEVLKLSVKPFRVERSMGGAIDELIDTMKQKAEQPRGDDPTTAQNKIALQIEQMRVGAKQQTDQAEIELKKQELEQKDRHKVWELKVQGAIKQDELQTKQQNERGKEMIQAQKAMQSREEHQAHMIENQQKMRADAQKNAMQAQALQQKTALAQQQNSLKTDMMHRQHQMKASDMAQRANERRQNQMFKLAQPPKNGPM